jgi:outer membrane protein assembly factor BamB
VSAQVNPTLSAEDLEPAQATALSVAKGLEDFPEFSAAQGAVVFHAGRSVEVGSPSPATMYVGAIDTQGHELFRFQQSPLTSGPQLDVKPIGLWAPPQGSAAFVTSVRDNKYGLLQAFRADGTQPFTLWQSLFILNPDTSAGHFITGDAAGKLLFLSGLQPFAPYAVLALDASTGTQVWKANLPNGSKPAAMVADAAGERVFLLLEFGSGGINSDTVLALDSFTGEPLWELGLTGLVGLTEGLELICQPDGELVFLAETSVPGSSGVAAIRGSTGQVVWWGSVPGRVEALAQDLIDPALLVLSRTQFGDPAVTPALLTALRPLTGLTKWTRPLGPPVAANGKHQQGLAVAEQDRRAFVAHWGTQSGTVGLAAVNLDGGDLLWSRQESAGLASDYSATRPLTIVGLPGQQQLAWYAAEDSPEEASQYRLSLRDFDTGDDLVSVSGGFLFGQARPLGISIPSQGNQGFMAVREGQGPRRVVAFERESAQPTWNTALGTTWKNGDPPRAGQRVASSTDGTRVFTTVDPQSTSESRRLVGLSGSSGATLWDIVLPDEAYYERDLEFCAGPGAPARVLVHVDGTETDSRLSRQVAVNANTGALLWDAKWPTTLITPYPTYRAGPLTQSPNGQRVAGAVWPDTLSTLAVLVRNSASGQLVFARQVSAADFAVPAAPDTLGVADLCYSPDGSRLYVLVGITTATGLPHRSGLLALNASTGAVLFAKLLKESPGASVGMPFGFLRCSADGLRLIAAVDAPQIGTRLYGLSANDGAVLWQQDRPGRIQAAELDSSERSLFVALSAAAGQPAQIEALDLISGAPMASAQAVAGPWAVSALAVSGASLWTLAGDLKPSDTAAAHLASFNIPALISGPSSLSLAQPVPLQLLLDRPQSAAGQAYLVLGSLSGTSPGLPLPGGLTLPLVADALTTLWLASPNLPPFSNGLGLLSPSGDARATLTLPSGLSPTLAGLTAHHAFVEFTPTGDLTYASPATAAGIVP